MKLPAVGVLGSLLTVTVLFSGCSTVDSRIKNHQSAFDSAPPTTQQKIRAGQVDVGFTPDQVIMALGEPDRRYTRTTANGTSEIWAYADKGPAFSFGIGMVGGGGGTAVGSGVAVGTGDRRDDKLRVIFVSGRVTALETRSKR
ncbi:MAG: hypothetical protein QM790_10190 [Nibricoccus sp.]